MEPISPGSRSNSPLETCIEDEGARRAEAPSGDERDETSNRVEAHDGAPRKDAAIGGDQGDAAALQGILESLERIERLLAGQQNDTKRLRDAMMKQLGGDNESDLVGSLIPKGVFSQYSQELIENTGRIYYLDTWRQNRFISLC